MKKPIPHILLVEDSPEDREAVMRAFARIGLDRAVLYCDDGDSALDYLYRRGDYSDPASSPRPGLILLDLNLPGTDGRDVLSRVKSDPLLCRIPIVILTTSSDPADVDACYGAGANSYLQKSLASEGVYETIRGLKDYWLELSLLPSFGC